VSTDTKAEKNQNFFGRDKEKTKILLVAVSVLIALLFTVLPLGLTHEAQVTLAIFVFTALIWVFEVMPLGVSAVLFGVLLTVIVGSKIMPPSIVFGGFANSTLWLMVGAFLLGEATTKTGLSDRIALSIIRLGGSSYIRILLFIWLANLVLALLVPSGTARLAAQIPIMVGIVNAYKAPIGSRFSANLLLHVFCGGSTWASVYWYTGTTINVIAMNSVEAITGYLPSFLTWFIWMIVPASLLGLGMWFIIQWSMPPEKEIIANAGSVDAIEKRLSEMGAIKAEEKRVAGYFIITILLWFTEPFHHIPSAWVAIGAGTLVFLPYIGVLKGKSLNNIPWDIVLLLGIALGMDGVMKSVGLNTWVIEKLLDPILGPLTGFGTLGLAFGIAVFVAICHFVMPSSIAEASLLCPLIANYAHINGFDVSMASVVAARSAQNLFIFPYQTLPLIVLWGTGFMNMKQCIKSCGALAVFNLIWITAMGPYWIWIMNLVK